ncbi:extensin family protein [Altererythrobacter sp.]|uniref:extensin family protein n=1 Tax=Altererythrobacter sp. TaxID=1872480 RepID=UPI003D00364D
MSILRAFAISSAALAVAGCGSVPETSREARAPVSAPRPFAVTQESRMCLAGLGETGSRFSPLPDRYYGGGCNTVNTVQLSAVQGDRSQFGVSNIGPVTCGTAQTFAAWARFGVDRAARQILGSPLARIETMGSYSCRNVAGTGRRSAHSRAAAIDVSAFVLEDGRRITVSADWSGGSDSERRFLRIVHRSACKRFGTVLGPNYNADHHDHFHLEQGDGSFCR